MPFSVVEVGWVPILVGLGLLLWGGFKALQRNIDRFVITNQRVFRVHGLLNRKEATMPLGRILDITVDKPLPGPDPRLRPLHLRVGRAGPGAARDPLRRAGPTSAT